MMRTAATALLRYVAWLAPLTVGLSACNSTSPVTRSLSVSTTTSPTSARISSGATGGSLTFSAAQVVLRKIELAAVGTTCATETEHDDAIRMSGMSSDDPAGDDGGDVEGGDQDEGCEGLELGPLTVNLPLDATTKVILDALVPAGTYTGVKAKLDAVTVSGVFTDPASMAHPFTFTSSGHAEVEIQFPTPITVGPTTSNVTVTVDVASWFKDASGAILDPADPTNLGTINRNIRRSFRAFGDADHDGVDDDHENDHAR